MPDILVIDDNEQVRIVIRKMLEAAGYRVREADDRPSGLCLYREHPADLVLCDLVTPKREALRTLCELLEEFPCARAIFVSGGSTSAGHDTLSDRRLLGSIRMLHKPFRRNALLNAVEQSIST